MSGSADWPEAEAVAKKTLFEPLPGSYVGDSFEMDVQLGYEFARKYNRFPDGTEFRTLTKSEPDAFIQNSRRIQQNDLEAKKLRYHIEKPWQIVEPYGVDGGAHQCIIDVPNKD
jgi:hypothetical protein